MGFFLFSPGGFLLPTLAIICEIAKLTFLNMNVDIDIQESVTTARNTAATSEKEWDGEEEKKGGEVHIMEI